MRGTCVTGFFSGVIAHMQVAPALGSFPRLNRVWRLCALSVALAIVSSLLMTLPVAAQTSTPTKTATATATATRTPSPTATPFPCPRDSTGMVGGYADIHRWNSYTLQVSQETGVPTNVIKAIMWVESNGQLNARSPLTSSGYYFGLMQVGATSSLPAQMRDVMWLCSNPYRQILAGATEMINKSIAINTRQWDLVAGAYFGYGVDVNGTSTSSYMNMFRQHVLNLTGTTPGGSDWIMPPTPTPGPTNTAGPALFSDRHDRESRRESHQLPFGAWRDHHRSLVFLCQELRVRCSLPQPNEITTSGIRFGPQPASRAGRQVNSCNVCPVLRQRSHHQPRLRVRRQSQRHQRARRPSPRRSLRETHSGSRFPG